jgi:hypothetical protein
MKRKCNDIFKNFKTIGNTLINTYKAYYIGFIESFIISFVLYQKYNNSLIALAIGLLIILVWFWALKAQNNKVKAIIYIVLFITTYIGCMYSINMSYIPIASIIPTLAMLT